MSAKKGNKQSKKKGASQKSNQSFLEKIKKRWSIISFLLLFGGIILVFYIFWASTFFQDHILNPILNFNALLGGAVLNVLGQDVQVFEDRIYSDDFQIGIRKGCDGVEALALYFTAVLTFSTNFRNKLMGLLVGGLFLLVMNLVRIVSLFLCGVYYPSIFEFMHIEVWQVLFIVIAITTWLFWVSWAKSGKKIQTDEPN